jgi:hypothetical protein
VNVYRSSPPLSGIFRPSHLLLSAYNTFVPDYEDSSEFESFNSDNKAASAEAAESARDEDRADSPSRSEGTCSDHPTSTRSAARKRSSSSQTADNRYVASRL